MMIKNTYKTEQFTGGDTRLSSSHSNEVAPRIIKSEVKMGFTIISLSTDNEHTGTLDDLVSFVNNHPDCRARHYEIVMPNNFANNPNPNFQSFLEHRGYKFNNRGQAIKSEVK
jgi:hypothetical protein